MVRVTGLEPAHRKIPDPKSGASANSAIPADLMENGKWKMGNGKWESGKVGN